jgi:hypothetical protein
MVLTKSFSIFLFFLSIDGPNRDLNEALRNTPRLPAFGKRMPRSFVLLLAEWENRGLEEFRNVSFRNTDAPTALAQAYAKRKYLYDAIVEGCTPGESLQQAASSLDRARGEMSMTNFYRHLHSADGTIVRRRRRRGEEAEEALPRRRPPPPMRAAPHPRPPRPPIVRRRVMGQQHRPQLAGAMIDGIPARQWMRANTDFRNMRWQGGSNQYTAGGRLSGLDDDFL